MNNEEINFMCHLPFLGHMEQVVNRHIWVNWYKLKNFHQRKIQKVDSILGCWIPQGWFWQGDREPIGDSWLGLVIQIRKCLVIFMGYFISGFWAFSGELNELGQDSSKDRGIWSFVIGLFHNNISTSYMWSSSFSLPPERDCKQITLILLQMHLRSFLFLVRPCLIPTLTVIILRK